MSLFRQTLYPWISTITIIMAFALICKRGYWHTSSNKSVEIFLQLPTQLFVQPSNAWVFVYMLYRNYTKPQRTNKPRVWKYFYYESQLMVKPSVSISRTYYLYSLMFLQGHLSSLKDFRPFYRRKFKLSALSWSKLIWQYSRIILFPEKKKYYKNIIRNVSNTTILITKRE